MLNHKNRLPVICGKIRATSLIIALAATKSLYFCIEILLK